MSKSNSHKVNVDQNYDQYKLIITTKEARKIIGKTLSDQLSDEELGRLIGVLSTIADRLIVDGVVPQNSMYGKMR